MLKIGNEGWQRQLDLDRRKYYVENLELQLAANKCVFEPLELLLLARESNDFQPKRLPILGMKCNAKNVPLSVLNMRLSPRISRPKDPDVKDYDNRRQGFRILEVMVIAVFLPFVEVAPVVT